MSEAGLLIVAGGVAVLAALASRSGLAGVPYQLGAAEVYQLADQLARRHFPDADPLMLTAMARIESSFRPGAIRHEPHIGDTSVGLMQTLYTTARWLHDEMGRQDFQLVSPDDLMDPQVSMYFGGSYVDWLRSYQGRARDEDWIVMSYNGGPGADNAQTRNHLAKYHDARADLRSTLAGVI